jgi:glutamine synthetase
VIKAGRSATRIEHRVAGADTNPYLVLAMILQAAYMGMVEKLQPGGPITGDAHPTDMEPLERSWHAAVQNFADSGFAFTAAGPEFRQLYSACKRQELQEFALRVTDVEYDAYIRTA